MTLAPVERELARLREHWEAFRADPKKRLLVWRIPENAGRFLQAFFAVQKHATPHTTGDLFIVFDAPFENTIQYSRALKASLAGQYAATHDAEDQKADLPTWTFDPTQSADSAEAVIAALRAFGSTHRDIIGHLVVVLMPGAIGNDAAFGEWIKRSLVAGLPERMRIAAIDSIETPTSILFSISRATWRILTCHRSISWGPPRRHSLRRAPPDPRRSFATT